jgi:AcrR family transcriptional regulator
MHSPLAVTRHSQRAASTIHLVSTVKQHRPRRGESVIMTASKPHADTPPLMRYEQILEAARTAIEEHGPDALTGQIAERAGLARPNVYRHFSSKEDLDQALARSTYRELRATVQAHLDLPGTALDVIHALVAAQVGWADSHPNLYRFLVSRGYQRRSRQQTVNRSDLAAEITEVAAHHFPRLADDPDAAEATLVGLIGLFDASVLRWLSRPVGTREQLIDRLTAQAWLIVDHHLREFGIHVDPAVSLPGRRRVGT